MLTLCDPGVINADRLRTCDCRERSKISQGTWKKALGKLSENARGPNVKLALRPKAPSLRHWICTPGLEEKQMRKKEERWVNAFDQHLYYECGKSESISMIISDHNNKHEDRVWDFSCKNTFEAPAYCSWTGFQNHYDEAFSFICFHGSVLAGVESIHDNKHEDRRWKFLCCEGSVKVNHACSWSDYVNDFDGYLRWDAPANRFLTGMESYHDNKREDRRWKYYSCEKSI
ncbi:hemagglutinin/amebocyte aggregation factor-like [Hyperolius riggenbachi]|uniref:hemagglutinin/amebocyte aggregation factor-like n=1 Tax=Hyperolius riggenbachi TaxID=752182 RepID=UPI0035A2B2A0